MIQNLIPSDEVISAPSKAYEAKSKTILLATDLSPECSAALIWATRLARTVDARLLIVHVEQPVVPYGGGEIYSDHVFDYHSKILLKLLGEVKPADPNVPYWHRLMCGNPAAQILRLAEQEKPEMIVISTHGRCGLPRLLIGSVAESVVRRAKCPVVVFKVDPSNERQSQSKD